MSLRECHLLPGNYRNILVQPHCARKKTRSIYETTIVNMLIRKKQQKSFQSANIHKVIDILRTRENRATIAQGNNRRTTGILA